MNRALRTNQLRSSGPFQRYNVSVNNKMYWFFNLYKNISWSAKSRRQLVSITFKIVIFNLWKIYWQWWRNRNDNYKKTYFIFWLRVRSSFRSTTDLAASIDRGRTSGQASAFRRRPIAGSETTSCTTLSPAATASCTSTSWRPFATHSNITTRYGSLSYMKS